MRTQSRHTFLIHLTMSLVVSLMASAYSLNAYATSFQSLSKVNKQAPSAINAPLPPKQELQAVQSMEDTLFGVRYDDESLDIRLNRLEETVFGQAQDGQAKNDSNVDNRIARLQKALSPSSLGPLAAPVKHQNDNPIGSSGNPKNQLGSSSAPSNAKDSQSMSPLVPPDAKPAPGETDYPTVSQMENKIFGKTYVQDDITVRLNRLEKEVFHAPQTGELADRVDNLKLIVLKNEPPPEASRQSYGSAGQGSGMGNPYYGGNPQGIGHDQIAYNPGGYTPYAAGSQSNAVTPDMISAINEVEKQVLGHEYPSEPFPDRLSRLETKLFKSTSPDMAPQDRLQRIIAVASAGGAPASNKTKVKNTLQILLPIILTILPLVLL